VPQNQKTVTPWAERLLALRKKLRWDQDEMGRFIGRGREWVSRLENGKGEFSDYVMLKVAELERMQSHHGDVTYDQAMHSSAPPDSVVREDRSELPDPAQILQESITQHMVGLLRAAGDDVQRLGWIAEQLRQQVAEPPSWGLHRRVIEEATRQDAAAHSSRKTLGKAG
jgi:transcriptional regulator with XRE-family HTH domain